MLCFVTDMDSKLLLYLPYSENSSNGFHICTLADLFAFCGAKVLVGTRVMNALHLFYYFKGKPGV